MTKPIEPGLVLKGNDTLRFDKYLNDPNDITPERRRMLIEARELAKTLDLNEAGKHSFRLCEILISALQGRKLNNFGYLL